MFDFCSLNCGSVPKATSCFYMLSRIELDIPSKSNALGADDREHDVVDDVFFAFPDPFQEDRDTFKVQALITVGKDPGARCVM